MTHPLNPGRQLLYTFKSKAAGNLIMLQPNGQRILEIIGKDAGPQGIILPDEMPAAIAALQAELAREEAAHKETGAPPPRPDHVSLRQRATPFLDMLKRCHQAGKEIVWGV